MKCPQWIQKFEMTPTGYSGTLRKLNHEKNQKSKSRVRLPLILKLQQICTNNYNINSTMFYRNAVQVGTELDEKTYGIGLKKRSPYTQEINR
jgi:hypothetical protein